MKVLNWYNENDVYRLAQIEASQCLMSENDTKHIAEKREIHHVVLTEHFYSVLSEDYSMFRGYCNMYNFESTIEE